MDRQTFDSITTQVEAHIASGASHDAVARNAELLSARLRFEFHPLVCDVVEGAFGIKGQPTPQCRHTSGVARQAAYADLATPPEKKAPEAKKK